jgi:hypothetical protein
MVENIATPCECECWSDNQPHVEVVIVHTKPDVTAPGRRERFWAEIEKKKGQFK